ncbi:MAG: right-handed parallel beta-helix repeat-containing protein [Maribacter sp.]|uniref:right-handed parallel beta-helix repeat-containing protein n=1 Tax=Maribacter sp. TaxID=1897614 RepID=UPI003C728594
MPITRFHNLLTLFFIIASAASAQEVITFKPQDGDMTPTVRKAIEELSDKHVKLVFTEGTYTFFPDYALEHYSTITNHGNGLKKVIFRLTDFDSVEIEGNGAAFIFHGQIAPFQFENCGAIKVNNLTLDWEIPFTFQGEVMAIDEKEGWRDIKPFTDGFSWELKDGRIHFPNIDGFSFDHMGSTLPFDQKNKRVSHGAWDINSNPRYVEKLANGNLRFHEPLKYYPPVGSILHSKGEHAKNRYAPAFQVKESQNMDFENITIHHALGMGFLFERSENIVISKCGIYVRASSDRVVSTIADATHFANCKGDILIENCEFRHMLDDGTNVHGTYVSIDEVIDEHTVRVGLMHFEQPGFKFADTNDEVWFIQNPDPTRGAINEVSEVKYINEKFSELTFKNAIPKDLKKGDIVENKTWNPTFTMRGCTIKDHRARNVIIKTPERIIIENNAFSSMMSSILLRGETFFWYESGAVNDVVIRNNTFKYVAYSGSPHAVLTITPRLAITFDKTMLYDSNILFEYNTIENFDSAIIWADRVNGLTIRKNTIKRTNDAEALYPGRPQFELVNSKNVVIEKNSYEGSPVKFIEADETSRATLSLKKNKGFQKPD